MGFRLDKFCLFDIILKSTIKIFSGEVMNIVFEVIKNSFVTLCYTLICITIVGFLIEIFERQAIKNIYIGIGYKGIIITGLGVVIHELSHLIFVLLGGMKPTEVKLFRPIKGYTDGRLGYVNYSYNKSNIIHRMFLFLVGIAPIIGGTLFLFVILKLLIPNTYFQLLEIIKYSLDISKEIGVFSLEFISIIMKTSFDMITIIFARDNFSKIQFWIFIFLAMSVASHMSLSSADVKGTLKGLSSVFILIFLVNVVMVFLGFSPEKLLKIGCIINTYILMFLMLAILFSIINVILTYIWRMIYRFIFNS